MAPTAMVCYEKREGFAMDMSRGGAMACYENRDGFAMNMSHAVPWQPMPSKAMVLAWEWNECMIIPRRPHTSSGIIPYTVHWRLRWAKG